VGVKPFVLVPIVLIVSSLLGSVSDVAVAAGDAVPSHCVAHTSFSDGADLAGDYRCAGMAVSFHTAGASSSPFPLWAGQWLFLDEAGHYRMGTCTFNRGTHPTALTPSRVVAQAFPNDPSGMKGAYLAWRYRTTTDPLVAAGLWAVFHHYALDAAGSNRSADPSAPLIPRLDGIAAASGRADLQAEAIALDAEARRMSGEWTIGVDVTSSSDGNEGTRADGAVTVTVLSGGRPVVGRLVTVLVSGDDVSHSATTGSDGRATVAVPLPSGVVTVASTAEAPGPVVVYRGSPAAPNPLGAQTLAVAGAPRVLRATATLTLESPPTTAPATTTVPATTVAATSTTAVATSTTAPATTAPTTTSPGTTAPAITLPPTSAAAPPVSTNEISPTTTAPASHPPLPTTGRGDDGAVAPLATAFLVGGVGLLGTLHRRQPRRRNDGPAVP
jgi:hypothetical protein